MSQQLCQNSDCLWVSRVTTTWCLLPWSSAPLTRTNRSINYGTKHKRLRDNLMSTTHLFKIVIGCIKFVVMGIGSETWAPSWETMKSNWIAAGFTYIGSAAIIPVGHLAWRVGSVPQSPQSSRNIGGSSPKAAYILPAVESKPTWEKLPAQS